MNIFLFKFYKFVIKDYIMKGLKSLKILAVIPARGNSQRVKNKNLRILKGKPLIYWSIKAAKESKYINNVTVSSDSLKILNISKKYLANTVLRPKNISGNVIMPDSALRHAYKFINKKFDYVVMLQPTCPLRTSKHIDEAIKKIYESKKDSLFSAYKDKDHAFIWKKKFNSYKPINYDLKKRPRSQDVDFYRENGSIYVTRPKILLLYNNRLGGKIDIYLMKKEHSLDIDTLKDIKEAKLLMKKNKNFI